MFNQGEVSTYIDALPTGSVIASESSQINLNNDIGDMDLHFGILNYEESDEAGDLDNTENSYDGKMDDVSFWSIALSLEEIQAYMDCSPEGNEEGIIGYWDFEEGSGETALDLSNGNNGIINLSLIHI